MSVVRIISDGCKDLPNDSNDGLGVIWVERFSSGEWCAAVYWTQLPAYEHQGTRPIRYGFNAYGETPDDAVANLRADMGLDLP